MAANQASTVPATALKSFNEEANRKTAPALQLNGLLGSAGILESSSPAETAMKLARESRSRFY